jgi:serine/threonine-protein kinase
MQRDGHDTNSTDRGPSANRPEPAADAGLSQRKTVISHTGLTPIENQPTVISSQPPAPLSTTDFPQTLLQTEQALVGRNLAHFQLLELVGGGGMGVVFRALDTMLERIVAVKVLSPQQARDKDTVRRFRNEAQSAARLDHDNIARVYYVGDQDGWSFIVLEYVDGVNLRDLVAQNGPFDPRQAFQVTLQIAEALDHASKRDVVHRDIKPSNVLLTPEGRAKLVDMGLARLHRVQQPGEELTASGVTLGTFDYISPEQARDPRSADVRSDMYSLGCTLFWMLTGRPPFPEGTVLQKLLRHSADAPPDPRQWRDDIPSEFVAILNRLLAKRPSDRYQKPSELIGELILAGERLGWQTTTRGEPIFIASKQSRFGWAERHLPWIVPAAIFFVFMVFLDPIFVSDQTHAANDPTFILPELIESFEDARGPVNSARDDVTTRPFPFSAETSEAIPDRDVAGEDSEIVAVPNGDAQREPEPGSEDDSVSGAHAPDTRLGPADASVGLESSAANGGLEARARIIVSNEPGRSRYEDQSRVFDSLRQAITHARAHPGIQRIELNFDGYVDAADLNGLDQPLTIAAGTGYHPTLILRAESTSDSNAPNTLFRVDGSPLTLSGVHLELRIPIDTISQRWSVFRIQHPSRVNLEACAITVQNSQGGRASFLDHVAVFDVVGQLETDDMLDPPSETVDGQTHIGLRNCAVRGEATLVRADAAVPLHMAWSNGLLVTTERLLTMAGSPNEFADSARPVELDLEHVTCVIDEGLAWLAATDGAPYLPRLSVQARDSLFVSTSWSSFISYTAPSQSVRPKSVFQYHGSRNFYQGILTYWKFAAGGNTPLRSINFQDWRTAPGVTDENPNDKTVAWTSIPKDNVPLHRHQVANYVLHPEGHPAVGSAPDGRDAGMYLPEVAQFPPPASEIIEQNLLLPF